MIRLGLRLTLGSGRDAILRVLVTAAAVALGVGLLLAVLAGMNGLHAQSDRGAWLDTSAQASVSIPAAKSLWWLSSTDQFGSQAIDRIDVAAGGPNAPIPPGISRLPGPGEYVASPALTELLRTVPANQLGDRFPGRRIGTMGPAGLPSPSSLIIVVGHTPRTAVSGAWGRQGRNYSALAGQLRCLPEHNWQWTCPAVHLGGRCGGLVATCTDIDRHRQSALCCSARGAVRGNATGRRHSASGRSDLGS